MKEPKSWILQTERLELRPVTKNDAEAFFPLLSDPDISRDMAWNAHSDLEQSRKFLEEAACAFESRRTVHWAVRNQGCLVGLFSLIDIRGCHRAIEYNRAELAYWLSPAKQRQGFMTEAGHSVIDFAFREMGLNKLIVAHHLGNAASEGLIRKLGFRKLYLEEQAFRKNGVAVDCIHYDLHRSAWELSRRKL
jgi:ribosomal-protein-alanine N-acetyltransferase